MKTELWTIPETLVRLKDLWDRGHGQMNATDLIRRARHHDAAVIEGLRRVKHLPDLTPGLVDVLDAVPFPQEPDYRGDASAASAFFRGVAGFTCNDWRMRVQVVKGLIYDTCVRLESGPEADFDAARAFALRFLNYQFDEAYARPGAAKEIDQIALHVGLIWAFQSLHAMVVHNINPEDLARESLRKYGHPVCRACLHPVCNCGRVKEGDKTALKAVKMLPDFDEFTEEQLARGGWKKAKVTPEMIGRITFANLAQSLGHCYDARNATFGGPLEGASRQRSEACGEYDGPAWMRETALERRDVRDSAFFVPSGYEEEIGTDPTGPQAREVIVKEASDACVSWPPVYANGLGIPWKHVLDVTFRHLEKGDASAS